MNDVSVIDRFLDVFSRYIDSGFGLLQGEVAFLTATLIAIDMTIAGLYWAMSHATGQGEDVIAKLRIPDELHANIEHAYYPAGHMMYVHEPTRVKQSRDLADFVRRAAS